jgi:hypothetical protein
MPKFPALTASRRRLSWAIPDQIVYGAGNVLLISQFARSTPESELAQILITYVIITVALTVARGGISEVLISSARTYEDHRSANANARIALLFLTLPMLLLGGALLVVDVSAVTLLLAGLPIVIIQDRMRFEWIQSGTPSGAFRLDAAWLAAQLGLLTATGSLFSPSSDVAAICWVGGCVISLVFAKKVHGPYRLANARGWIGDNLSPILFTVGQVAGINISGQAPVFIFSLTNDPHAAAGYLAATQLLSPQTALLVAIRPLVQRRIAVEYTRLSNSLVWRTSLTQVVPLLGAGLLLGAVLLIVFGERLYGASVADAATQIIWWLAFTKAIGALSVTFVGLLRADGRWPGVLGGELLTSLVLGGFPALAALGTRQPGAVAAAQALGALVSVGIWWSLARRPTHRDGA